MEKIYNKLEIMTLFFPSDKPSGKISVDYVWFYTPGGSPQQIKIWNTHHRVVHQLSELWFTHMLGAHLNSTE